MNKKEKCKDSQLSRKVIHLGDIEKRVYEEELPEFLASSWELGYSGKHLNQLSQSHKGKIPWNKGTKRIMKPNKTTFKKGSVPWNKGLKGVQRSWNKGLTKETDERVAQCSDSNKKNWETNKTRKEIVSKNAKSRAGKHLSTETHERFLERNYITRKNNSSFNTSKPEESYYRWLCDVYGSDDIIRNYRDKKRYPYRCDFYIKSLDLFIELNLHWTHGHMPFNENSDKCIEQLKEWQEKATKSKFYLNAIETWTVRDVKKLKTALENKLNYEVLYDIDKQ